ncbi:L-arabinose transport system permease protein AraQ [Arthrobacter sp. Hiyo6]|nr:L-arabinose transport system permease protein AraQ [Arthrobacter sp. Hiyo6]
MTTTAAHTNANHAAAPKRPFPGVPRRRRKTNHSTVLTIAVWACVAYFILPLLWLFIASTKSNSDLFSTFGYGLGHTFELFGNIAALFTKDGGIYWTWMLNTLLYAGVSAVGAAFFATAAGYAFAKYRFPGDTTLFYSILGAIMIPTTALALPTYLLFANAGLTNTPSGHHPALTSEPVRRLPHARLLRRCSRHEPHGAARIDGAGEFRIFFQVGLRSSARELSPYFCSPSSPPGTTTFCR